MQALAPKAWKAFLAALEIHFEQPVDASKWGQKPDLEGVFRQLLPEAKDHFWRGRIVIGHELRIQLGSQLGIEPEQILITSKRDEFLPPAEIKARWSALKEEQDWQLPRLGLPVWLQYIWGAALLAAVVGSFFWPLWCLLAFWLLVILIYPAEKWFSALAYPDFDQVLAATVRLNWPILEMGGSGDDRLRLVFAELLQRFMGIASDPHHEFPQLRIDQPWLGEVPQFHLLNGDSLRMQLAETEFEGSLAVMRECLLVGPVKAGPQFWEARKQFIHASYNASPEKYAYWLEAELEKLRNLPPEAEINLWFEDDLFCQVNFWFCIQHIRDLGIQNKLFRVFPKEAGGEQHWLGFGGMQAGELLQAFQAKVQMEKEDRELACLLWQSFQTEDRTALQKLAKSSSKAFRKLEEVLQAQLDRPQRPLELMRKLRSEGISEFKQAFPRFNAQMGIYGFGDLQAEVFWNETGEEKP